LSPLSERYRQDIASISGTLNSTTPDAIRSRVFENLAEGVALLDRISAGL